MTSTAAPTSRLCGGSLHDSTSGLWLLFLRRVWATWGPGPPHPGHLQGSLLRLLALAELLDEAGHLHDLPVHQVELGAHLPVDLLALGDPLLELPGGHGMVRCRIVRCGTVWYGSVWYSIDLI